jgi:mannosyl-3-phosphoglycerate phosphatase
MTQYLVFTDLDGTLLDHHTYSFDAAMPAVRALQGNKAHIIFNTSKTFIESRNLQLELGFEYPLIVENGAAVFLPKTIFNKAPKDCIEHNHFWLKTFTQRRAHWLSLLEILKPKWGHLFTHFDVLTIEQIMEHTGLSLAQCEHAKTRLFGEPIVWRGSDDQKVAFISELKLLGAEPLQGGRFLHLSGDSNKGKAMRWLCQVYADLFPTSQYASIALGDGANDIAMLEIADIAIQIKSPAYPYPHLKRTEGVFQTQNEGPSGWNEAIFSLCELT